MARRKADAPRWFNSKHDTIIVAWAEYAAGPGWANAPVWVLVRDRRDGRLRQECLQPEEQTAVMLTLYGVSAHVSVQMLNAVRALCFQR